MFEGGTRKRKGSNPKPLPEVTVDASVNPWSRYTWSMVVNSRRGHIVPQVRSCQSGRTDLDDSGPYFNNRPPGLGP